MRERQATAEALTERALAWFADHAISAQRVMTDGACSYTHNRALRDRFAEHEIRHIITPPYTPR